MRSACENSGRGGETALSRTEKHQISPATGCRYPHQTARRPFSYGRALQDPALEAWHGLDENLKAGQQALYHRARCNGAASMGAYTDEMEGELVGAGSSAHRREWDDD